MADKGTVTRAMAKGRGARPVPKGDDVESSSSEDIPAGNEKSYTDDEFLELSTDVGNIANRQKNLEEKLNAQ